MDQAVLFETDDLVERKNEKNVVYTLMEVARVQNSVPPPSLIRLEREIDAGMVNSGGCGNACVSLGEVKLVSETRNYLLSSTAEEDDEKLKEAISQLCFNTGHSFSRYVSKGILCI